MILLSRRRLRNRLGARFRRLPEDIHFNQHPSTVIRRPPSVTYAGSINGAEVWTLYMLQPNFTGSPTSWRSSPPDSRGFRSAAG